MVSGHTIHQLYVRGTSAFLKSQLVLSTCFVTESPFNRRRHILFAQTKYILWLIYNYPTFSVQKAKKVNLRKKSRVLII